MKKIRLMMIGGGIGAFIGGAHRRAAGLSNSYEFIGGVPDADPEKGKQFAIQEGLDLNRVYANVDEMIKAELALPEGERAEAVAIVTPNHLHYKFAKALIENNFHVICEKPMTITVEEAEDLQRLVEKHKITFSLTHTYTGYPMVRQMRELVQKGVLGKIHRIDAQYYQGWMNNIIYENGHTDSAITGVWRLDPKQSGASSCIGDIGVHAFNLIEYTSGLKVTKVLSDLSTVKETVQLDLDGTVLLRFKDNVRGIVRASQVAAGEENNISIAIYGSKASLKWGQENPNYLYSISDTEPTKIYKPGHGYNARFAESSHVMPPGHPEGIYESLGNIYLGAAMSIRGEKTIDGQFPTVKEGVRGMKFIHTVLKSNKNGNIWVDL